MAPATSTPATSTQDERTSALREVTAAAADILTSPPRRAAAVSYLRQRGVDATVLPDWPLGYAPPGWTRLTNTLHDDFGEQLLIDSGLARRSSRGSLIDTFRDRVIFPLRDAGGDVAGFIGRDLSGDPAAPKYLNSRRTPIYAKSDLLYGLAEGIAAQPSTGRPVLLEGPVDVLAVAARARTDGRPDLLPVAAGGTAFTTLQARTLLRTAPGRPAELVIALDGDAAGRAAALRAGERARAAGADVRVSVLPNGLDPADYLAQPDSTVNTFTPEHAVPLLAVHVQAAIAAQGDRMQWIEGRLAAARSITAHLATYPASHTADQIGWIADTLHLDAATFTFELVTAYRTAHTAGPNVAPPLLREPVSI